MIQNLAPRLLHRISPDNRKPICTFVDKMKNLSSNILTDQLKQSFQNKYLISHLQYIGCVREGDNEWVRMDNAVIDILRNYSGENIVKEKVAAYLYSIHPNLNALYRF